MITLATLPTATAQEIFTQVKNHLFSQREKAQLTPSSTCRYRLLKNGKMLKCAAGCLISDREYNENMEGRTWTSVKDIPQEHKSLIVGLQLVHDTFEINDWEHELRYVAKAYNLVF